MAIARVQSATGTRTGVGSTLALTISAPTAGNVLLVVAGGNDSAGATLLNSITQTGGTWVKDVINAYSNTVPAQVGIIEIWRETSLAATGTTVTLNFTTSSVRGEAVIVEVSGLATSSNLDKAATRDGTWDGESGADEPPRTGTTASTSQANEYVLGGTHVTKNNAIQNNGGEATWIANVINTETLSWYEGIETAIAAMDGIGEWAGAAAPLPPYSWGGAIATYKEAAAVGGPNTLMLMGVGI